MVLIIGIGRRDAGKQILIIFARQQIAVLQRVLAEFGQQRIAAFVGDDIEPAHVDRLAVALRLFIRRVGVGRSFGFGPLALLGAGFCTGSSLVIVSTNSASNTSDIYPFRPPGLYL